MRAGAGPGCGELKTKGLLRFPPAGGCGAPREGARRERERGALKAGAPKCSLPAPLAPPSANSLQPGGSG